MSATIKAESQMDEAFSFGADEQLHNILPALRDKLARTEERLRHFEDANVDLRAQLAMVKSEQATRTEDDTELKQIYEQLKYKDNRIMELNNVIMEKERRIMDLQELCREHSQVATSKRMAVQIVNRRLRELDDRQTRDVATDMDASMFLQPNNSLQQTSNAHLSRGNASNGVSTRRNESPGRAISQSASSNKSVSKSTGGGNSPPPVDPSEDSNLDVDETWSDENSATLFGKMVSDRKTAANRKRVTFDFAPVSANRSRRLRSSSAERGGVGSFAASKTEWSSKNSQNQTDEIDRLITENQKLRSALSETRLKLIAPTPTEASQTQTPVKTDDEITVKQSNLNGVEAEKSQQQENCVRMLRARAAAQLRIRELEENIANLQLHNAKELENITAINDTLKTSREWLLNENGNLLKKNEELRTKVDDLLGELDASLSTSALFRTRLDEAERRVEALSCELTEARRSLHHANDTKHVLINEVERLKEALYAQDEFIGVLEADLIVYEAHVGMLRDSLGATKKEQRQSIKSKAYFAKINALEMEKQQIVKRSNDDRLLAKALSVKIKCLEQERNELLQRLRQAEHSHRSRTLSQTQRSETDLNIVDGAKDKGAVEFDALAADLLQQQQQKQSLPPLIYPQARSAATRHALPDASHYFTLQHQQQQQEFAPYFEQRKHSYQSENKPDSTESYASLSPFAPIPLSPSHASLQREDTTLKQNEPQILTPQDTTPLYQQDDCSAGAATLEDVALKELYQNNSSLKEELKNCQQELEESLSKIAVSEQQISDLEQKMEGLTAENVTLRRDIEIEANSKLEFLQRLNDTYVESCSETADDAESDATTASISDLAAATNKLGKLSAVIQALRQQLTDTVAQLCDITQRLTAAGVEMTTAKGQLRELESTKIGLITLNDKLSDEKREVLQRCCDVEAQLAHCQMRLCAAENAQTDSAARTLLLESQLTAERNRCEQLFDGKQRAEFRFQEVEKHLHEMMLDKESSEQKLAVLQDSNAYLSATLEREKGRLERLVELLRCEVDRFRVEAELSRNCLQDLRLNNSSTTQQQDESLQQHQQNVLLSLELIHEEHQQRYTQQQEQQKKVLHQKQPKNCEADLQKQQDEDSVNPLYFAAYSDESTQLMKQREMEQIALSMNPTINWSLANSVQHVQADETQRLYETANQQQPQEEQQQIQQVQLYQEQPEEEHQHQQKESQQRNAICSMPLDDKKQDDSQEFSFVVQCERTPALVSTPKAYKSANTSGRVFEQALEKLTHSPSTPTELDLEVSIGSSCSAKNIKNNIISHKINQYAEGTNESNINEDTNDFFAQDTVTSTIAKELEEIVQDDDDLFEEAVADTPSPVCKNKSNFEVSSINGSIDDSSKNEVVDLFERVIENEAGNIHENKNEHKTKNELNICDSSNKVEAEVVDVCEKSTIEPNIAEELMQTVIHDDSGNFASNYKTEAKKSTNDTEECNAKFADNNTSKFEAEASIEGLINNFETNSTVTDEFEISVMADIQRLIEVKTELETAVDVLKSEIWSLNNQLRKQLCEHEEVAERLSVCERLLEESNYKLRVRDEDAENLRAALAEKSKAFEQILREKTTIEAESKALTEKCAQLQKQLAAQQSSIEELTETRRWAEILEEETTRLRSTLTDNDVLVTQLRDELEMRVQQLLELRIEKEEIGAESARLLEQLRELQKSYETLATRTDVKTSNKCVDTIWENDGDKCSNNNHHPRPHNSKQTAAGDEVSPKTRSLPLLTDVVSGNKLAAGSCNNNKKIHSTRQKYRSLGVLTPEPLSCSSVHPLNIQLSVLAARLDAKNADAAALFRANAELAHTNSRLLTTVETLEARISAMTDSVKSGEQEANWSGKESSEAKDKRDNSYFDVARSYIFNEDCIEKEFAIECAAENSALAESTIPTKLSAELMTLTVPVLVATKKKNKSKFKVKEGKKAKDISELAKINYKNSLTTMSPAKLASDEVNVVDDEFGERRCVIQSNERPQTFEDIADALNSSSKSDQNTVQFGVGGFAAARLFDAAIGSATAVANAVSSAASEAAAAVCDLKIANNDSDNNAKANTNENQFEALLDGLKSKNNDSNNDDKTNINKLNYNSWEEENKVDDYQNEQHQQQYQRQQQEQQKFNDYNWGWNEENWKSSNKRSSIENEHDVAGEAWNENEDNHFTVKDSSYDNEAEHNVLSNASSRVTVIYGNNKNDRELPNEIDSDVVDGGYDGSTSNDFAVKNKSKDNHDKEYDSDFDGDNNTWDW